mmetsp:Transcript_53689/g.125139  ORF Transcript_53689/g.125139 Transcript_53689/m.125139 type:complete len:839 (-) Transcript_53689:163-2679(-)
MKGASWESEIPKEKEELSEFTVPQSIYLSWIRQELDDEQACLELPFIILVLLSFTFMSVLALSQHVVLSVEQAIENDILNNANFAFSEYMGHKALMDVHSFGDFWSWLRLGFVPLTLSNAWVYSEHRFPDVASAFDLNYASSPQAQPNDVWNIENRYNIPVSGDYLHYNRIIGGLRFRQQVAPDAACKFPGSASQDLWKRWYGKPCMPAYEELVFEPDTSNGENFQNSERQEWILKDDRSIVQQLVDMEDGCATNNGTCNCNWCASQTPPSPWLTERTRRIEVAMVSFNAEYGLLTLTGVNVWIARGGRMRKRVELMSLWINFSQPTAANLPALVFAAIWLLCLLYIFFNELVEIVYAIRNAESRWHRALLEDYIGLWNIVDWMSISVAVLVLVMYAGLATETAELQRQLGRLQAESPLERQMQVGRVATFYEAVEAVSTEEKRFRLTLCFYPMLLMLRLFKSFAAQPRLAVVTDTIKLASQDLLHFGIVSVAVLACLCLNAVLLFGRDEEAFGNLFRSLHSSFRMMFGDWDWEPMERVSRTAAYLWFTMFMVLVVIILLNMLLAIILDNYMDVKRVSASADSLQTQMIEMHRRRKMLKRRERVSLNNIWDNFVKEANGRPKIALSLDRPISAEKLQQIVPGIPFSQASRTLQNSWVAHLKATTAPFELKHSSTHLAHFEQETRRVRNGLFFIFDRLDFYDTRLLERDGADSVRSQTTLKYMSLNSPNSPSKASSGSLSGRSASAREAREAGSDMEREIDMQMQRLSVEAAEKLATVLSVVDKTQGRIEEKQASIQGAMRDMLNVLLQLQSLLTQISRRLEGFGHRKRSFFGLFSIER